jgi:hypothetical protein
MAMNPDGRQPTLNDARARVARAEEHIARLESQCASILAPNTTIVVGTHNSPLLGIPPNIPQAPPILSILVGEAIYNLRSALDYLVYELVYLDGGKLKNDTNFPIVETEKEWNNLFPRKKGGKKRRTDWFYVLSPAHQAAIKRFQPCQKCLWMRTLSSLSNPDKHRRLTFVKPITTFQAGDSAKTANLTWPMMVTLRFTGKIALHDGSGVIETLKLLKQEVSDVIEAFDPDLQ